MPDDPTRYEPDRIDEYLRSLQGQLDQALERNRRLEARVTKLESDRDQLRTQLDAARSRKRLVGGGSRVDRPPPPSRPVSAADVTAARPPQVGPIPELPLPNPSPRLDLSVATVLDPFSRAAYCHEFHCIDLEPDDWREQLERDDPALLFVESVFSGPGGKWASRVARFGSPSPVLAAIVEWFCDRGRPTVFWNKEDPINYDWFEASASLFDHVLTVDGDSIPRYRADLGHPRVGLLQFGAQPVIHHPPADPGVRTGSVAFAGSYYARKHPERRVQMDYVLGPAREFGLDIFDRAPGSDERFSWPEEYRAHIVGSLTYPQTLEAYRRYRVFLNVNTITDSSTMFARRVFELLASGTVVVSGPSRAMQTMLPPEIVAFATSASDTRQALERLIDDPDERGRRSREGLEWIVAERHTMKDRVDDMLAAVL